MIDHSALKWGKARSGLLPVVIQDADTGRVLMLAYMNQEALQRTLETRKVTFFSRSRGQLWEKGETSGNTLQLVSIVADCDGDTILIKALPHGPTCHKGTVSCFAGAESGLESLGRVGPNYPESSPNLGSGFLHEVSARARSPAAGSQAAGGSRGSVPCCSSGGPGTHRRGGCRSHLPPSRPTARTGG